MESRVNQPTTALVLETNNLRGDHADPELVVKTLERLLVHLRGQTRPLSQLNEVVVTHDGISEVEQVRLQHAAGVVIRFVRISPDCGYYQAKNAGFDATSADIVAFGDTDCWPDSDWLDCLLKPFEARDAAPLVVAGRTTYRKDLWGIAASTIDFMYFPSPLGPDCTRNFYANNVAFKREAFAEHRYAPAEGIYRGHCQVLGLRLQSRGVKVAFEPKARTTHRFPDSLRDFLRLRLLRGEDAARLTPYLAEAYLPPRFQALGRTGPIASLAVLGIRFACSLRAIGRQDMPALTGWRRLGCVGIVAGISVVDAVGSITRGFPLSTKQRPMNEAEARSLSYHRNVDGLVSSHQRNTR